MTPWETLGVATDVAVPDLRRRYAALIKEFRPETHPQDFARIREAYEVVLPHARRREALAAERAATGDADVDVVAMAVEDVAPVREDASDPTPLDVEADAVTTLEVVAPPHAEAMPPEEAAEPALATQFRRFHAQAESARGSDDEAHLPALRELLQARTQATLDDSQALEFALMRWFVEADSPPLTLLFETGRAFDWHRHPARLSNWLSPWALRQMEARLSLSRDLVYARHFSGNAWLRRVHAKQAGWPVLIWRPAVVEAMSWVERWRHASEDADAPALQGCLDQVALRQLRGLASTDLLVGLIMGLCAPDLGHGVVWWILASAVVFGLRRALRALGELPETDRLRRVAVTLDENKPITGVMAALGALFAAIVLMAPAPGFAAVAVGLMLGAPMALIAISGLWRIAAYLEQAVAWFFQWREAVDRLEFDSLLRGDAAPTPGRPFGARLALVRRLKAIPAALRLQNLEIALRERPPRAQPFGLLFKRRSRGASVIWRRIWFTAWVLFAIARLAHTFGGH